MMRADGAGRIVCLSVCPGENYKALEAPADFFAPAFFWALGGRERERNYRRQGPRAPAGLVRGGGGVESLRTATVSVTPPPTDFHLTESKVREPEDEAWW